MLPCPRHARHLVVSASTASYTFGGAFNEAFEDAHKMEVFRQKPVFDLARAGYEALFNLAPADASYVNKQIDDLHNQTLPSFDNSAHRTGIVVGIHVRHGDRRPYEFQYKDSYVPLDRYSAKARSIINSTSFGEGGQLLAERNIMVIASDDPEVYESEEFSRTARAQNQIQLASKSMLDSAKPSYENPRKFVDETVGWEGGFFAGMFWSLGRPSSVPATAVELKDTNLPPTEEALRLRELLGRAYLMDLAVLAGSDSVVCTVSSMGCKLLAVMMGWEQAIVNQNWVNIDGDFEWRGVSW
jgi:hypothetical protein